MQVLSNSAQNTQIYSRANNFKKQASFGSNIYFSDGARNLINFTPEAFPTLTRLIRKIPFFCFISKFLRKPSALTSLFTDAFTNKVLKDGKKFYLDIGEDLNGLHGKVYGETAYGTKSGRCKYLKPARVMFINKHRQTESIYKQAVEMNDNGKLYTR